jgi:hypothetical protein
MVNRFVGAASAVALVGAVLAFPSGVEAVSVGVEYGKTGRVVTPAVNGWWSLSGNTLQVPPVTAFRTKGTRRTRRSAKGTQKICARIDLYKFGAGYYERWGLEAQHNLGCYRVPRGYRLDASVWNYSAQPYVGYSVNVVVSWRAATGRRLARATYDYDDATSDYVCQTIKCTTLYGKGGVAEIFFDL